MRPQSRRLERGFTLVELMIVVAVIGVIASLAIPNYLRFTARSTRTEMLETVSKMKLYFKNIYDNNGSMSVSGTLAAGATSDVNPDPSLAAIGQPLPWDSARVGWSDFQFPPEGAIKMRYSYSMGAADADGKVHDVTINVCGSFPGLGDNSVTCDSGMMGNYRYTEVFHGNGSSDPSEFPGF